MYRAKLLNSTSRVISWRHLQLQSKLVFARHVSNQIATEKLSFADRDIILESGRIGTLADGVVFAKYGDSSVLVSAVSSTQLLDQDFMPLQVEYREKAFAAGLIPSTFVRREMNATDKEILSARLIDRTLRPLFPPGYMYDTQLITTVLSYNTETPVETLSIVAASAALGISDIPFHGPVAAVKIGYLDGRLVVNPTAEEESRSQLDLLYAGTGSRCVMLEAAAAEISEETMKEAFLLAESSLQPLLGLQNSLVSHCGKPKRQARLGLPSEQLFDQVRTMLWEDAIDLFRQRDISKAARNYRKDELTARVVNQLFTEFAAAETENSTYQSKTRIRIAAEEVLREALRFVMLEGCSTNPPEATCVGIQQTSSDVDGQTNNDLTRCDGRRGDELRSLRAEVDVIPRVHGSALFSRGDTQSLCTTTLGPPTIAQRLRPIAGGPSEKRFMLHYDFPPYSVNETGRVFGTNRRMVGHGALAEKAIASVIPSPNDFPYVIRCTSEISGSDGSSSMASVCGASLALLDAGVPIKNPVAGISIGLVTPPGLHRPDKDNWCMDDHYDQAYNLLSGDPTSWSRVDTQNYSLITDIAGIEDHFGDMDFKVAGTSQGITAIQMDVKLPGIPLQILLNALKSARTARMTILDTMNGLIRTHRPMLKPTAPRTEILQVPIEMRGRIIGPGGMVLRGIELETGAALRFSPDPGNEALQIFASDEQSLERAIELVQGILVSEDSYAFDGGNNVPFSSEITVLVGDEVQGEVVSVLDFGVLVSVENLPKPGLLHISQISQHRLRSISDALKLGSRIKARVIDVDAAGQAKFSVKALLDEGRAWEDCVENPKSLKESQQYENQPSEKSSEKSLANECAPYPNNMNSPEHLDVKTTPPLPAFKDLAYTENTRQDPLDLYSVINFNRLWFSYVHTDDLPGTYIENK